MNLIIPMLAGVVIDTVLQANAESMVREVTATKQPGQRDFSFRYQTEGSKQGLVIHNKYLNCCFERLL